MRAPVKLAVLGVAAFAVAVPPARGQNVPHLAYLLPAGGQQGTTVEVKAGGQFLSNITAVYVSGRGIEATAGEHSRPMNARQAMELRDKLRELQKQPTDAALSQQVTDIQVKLQLFAASRLISPVLAETVAIRVAIAADAEPGVHELRVATRQGLSNPMVFHVGHLPEIAEPESIAVEKLNPAGTQVRVSQPPTEMSVTLPVVINGRIKPYPPKAQVPARPGQPFTPGEKDRYRFRARRGENLVAAVTARELIPYLADAVPGWAQAVLTLYDAEGRQVAYNDDFRFHPDPVLHCVIPADGEYVLEIRDAIYRGREDFIYRLAIGQLPFVTDIFPLGARAGSKTRFELSGWNLPVTRTALDTKAPAPVVRQAVIPKGEGILNSVSIAIDTLPEQLEKEGNDTPAKAQRVKLPVIVNGRIGKAGDWDVYRLDGRAGQVVVAEVNARRLGSPLDSVLRLTDAAGAQLALNDDHTDKGAGLETHHADSLLKATLPRNGKYYLFVGNTQRMGGPEYAYRLRIGPPRPDFELRVTPSSINGTGGATVPITVHAIRRDDFAGEIELALKDAPKGLVMSGGRIPTGQDEVRVTLTLPPQPKPQPEPLSLTLEGRAMIQGREIVRTAAPAESMMQAFAYWHLVPAHELKLAIRRGATFRTAPRVISGQPLRIPAGGTARIQVQVPAPAGAIEGYRYELSEPPAGIEVREVSSVPTGTEILLGCDAAKAKPGLKGNLIVSLSAERKPPAGAARPNAARQRIPMGALPAVPFEVVP